MASLDISKQTEKENRKKMDRERGKEEIHYISNIFIYLIPKIQDVTIKRYNTCKSEFEIHYEK